jgi:GntR family transcriptional regulator, carbon starvation induced regulator
MTTPPVRSDIRKSAPEAAPNRTLVEDVYERLLADITSGRLAPGQKLPFDMLKRTYGFSVSTLREALQRLGSEGLVNAHGHVGFHVADVSIKELRDLNALRLLLEPLALKESVSAGDVNWETGVITAAYRLRRLPVPTDSHSASADAWEEAHRELHDALIAACPNVMLLQFSRTLFQQMRRYRRIFLRRYWTSPTVREPVEKEHSALVEAVLDRDTERAASCLHEHYANGFERVLREYQSIDLRRGAAVAQ